MKSIFKTETDGWCTQEKMYYEFIKSMGLVKEYGLWHTSVVEEEMGVHD